MDEKLFPELPEDFSALSDQEIEDLEREHLDAAEQIKAEDEEFLKGLSAETILSEFERGVEQVEKIRAYRSEQAEMHQNYVTKKDELAARLSPDTEIKAEEEPAPDDPSEPDDPEGAEVVEETVEEPVLVTASAEVEEVPVEVKVRRTPPPTAERIPEPTSVGASLMAAGEFSNQFRNDLDPKSLAEVVIAAAQHYGPHPKDGGTYSRYGGPTHKVARAEFAFPPERTLGRDAVENSEKLAEVIVAGIPGGVGQYSLTASGGLCAPLTPIYSMPNFATEREPVWDALPKFRADRGGVNVPEATTIGDITTAISSISEANDALGGTFATKSCQDLTCPEYTEVAVQILAHCREYGNLNARAWPEKIAHENALTMAALARTSEGFMLDRIKALSVNVTNGADTLGALIYLVDGIVKAAYGIRSRLRMPREARFRALLPAVILDMLLLDTISTQFDRFRDRASLDAYLRSTGIDPVYFIDTPSTGESQIADASQAAGALDGLPDEVQWAIYPEGTFIGVDMGTLELGIVRDSTLNSTNDFQVFGEEFRNVARIGPAQGALWVTTNLCPVGQFPPAGTARTCESA